MASKKISLGITIFTAFLFLTVTEAYAISWQYSLDAALKEAKNKQRPILIDFTAAWCPWCKKMDSQTYSDKKVNDLSLEFICVKVDGDKNRDTVVKYGVRGFPATIFLNYEGAVDEKLAGFRGPVDFTKTMEGVLKKTKKGVKKEGLVDNQPLKLNGIMFDPSSPLALINDKVIKVGDIVSGAKVLAITENKVIVSLGGKEIILSLD